MKRFRIINISILLFLYAAVGAGAQGRTDSLINEKGRFDQWRVYQLKESGIIGGNVKTIYKLSEGDTLYGQDPCPVRPEDVFSPCNIMADVMGVIKGSNSVVPERRGDGWCARLSVLMEKVRVLGMINMEVLVQGTVLTGTFHEPIRDTKGAYTKLDCGIPFTWRPSAVQYDYKAVVGNTIVRSTGFSPRKVMGGKDYPYIAVYLQHREEDSEGNVTATRVGTAFKKFTLNQPDWKNGERLEVRYGDISSDPDFIPEMGLKNGDIVYYCLNSKGRTVPIQENGWAAPEEEPTHIIIWISSSCGEAFYGGLGNTLWIDNFKLIY
ncbi:MAG TPA: PCMD domain-containing protein [Candidatus Coprenecus merdigallinarum]|nr:PCMD domain-containing protein [Candidatus Coprenecus merdigallinarum]